MLDFRDLEPLEDLEGSLFGDWLGYLKYTEPDPISPDGLRISLKYSKIIGSLLCQRDLPADPKYMELTQYHRVSCLRPIGHTGKCVCCLPTHGKVSK